MLARQLHDPFGDFAAALGDDARRTLLVVMQRDSEWRGCPAHEARFQNWPAAAEACGGGPPMAISPGSRSASRSACDKSGAPSRNRAMVSGRSAHSRTEARSPDSAIMA